MKLLSFSITNFRSITKAHKIDLSGSNVAVFVGKNNEWKSNILKALNICMNVIRIPMFRYANPSIIRREAYLSKRNMRILGNGYDWGRDFPIWIRNEDDECFSSFQLEFSFNDDEILEFKQIINKKFKKDKILLNIFFWKESKPTIKVPWISESNGEKLITFISNKIDFTYIPAVRTEREIIDMINSRISFSLKELEYDREYQNAIKKIQKLQKPIFSRIEKAIKWPIQSFIPDVKNVKIKRKDESIQLDFWSIAELYIDDGTETQLEYKWDWIKNLISISLLHNVGWLKKTSLVAIEEPEAHLHPEAIHYLKDVIYKLWESWQILISTHNPLLVNRENIQSNIIVNNWEARPANNIEEIRNILWIEQSDNLINKNKVLVVEWENDVKSLKAIFKKNKIINKAISNWNFDIIPLGSAWNLSFMLQSLQNSLTKYIVVLDKDEAWIEAIKKAKDKWYLDNNEYMLLSCIWMKESEFEDIINEEIYKKEIFEKFWVDIERKNFLKWKWKWSQRMESVFNSQWKIRDDKIKLSSKMIVSESVENNPSNSIKQWRWDIIEEIGAFMERFINSSS